jgi:1-acyl-sn-glycerol-3-phosphate acyltransferase
MKTLLKIISKTILFFWGWEIIGTFPKFSKAIIIVAPHRKGFADVLLGWCVQNIHPIPNKKFLAKYEAVQLPLVGWILKQLGAIAIDRNRESSKLPKGFYIDDLVKKINQEKTMTLVITPEGTRAENAPWKRGFYEIAIRAKIPVIMIAFDYKKKRVIIDNKLLDINEEDLGNKKDYIRLWYTIYIPEYTVLLD